MERHAVIVAGFGFRSAATEASLADALARTGGTPQALAAPEDKAQTPLFRRFAAAQHLPVVAIDTARLTAQTTATRSPASAAARGTGSVAEAAALAAAGPGATLLAPRAISEDRCATCALARGTET